MKTITWVLTCTGLILSGSTALAQPANSAERQGLNRSSGDMQSNKSADAEHGNWYPESSGTEVRQWYPESPGPSVRRWYTESPGAGVWHWYSESSGKRLRQWYSGQHGEQADRNWYRTGRAPRGQDQWNATASSGASGPQRFALVGKITSLKANVGGVSPESRVIAVRTQHGNQVDVDLGPNANLKRLNLQPGESIFVGGRMTNIAGEQVLVAEDVAKVSRMTLVKRGKESEQQPTYGYAAPEDQRQQSGKQQNERQQESRTPREARPDPAQSGSRPASYRD